MRNCRILRERAGTLPRPIQPFATCRTGTGHARCPQARTGLCAFRAPYSDRDNIGNGLNDYGGILLDPRNTGSTGVFVANDTGGGSAVIPGVTSSSLVSIDFGSTVFIAHAKHDMGLSFLVDADADSGRSSSAPGWTWAPT
jgi:hypothetical protein